MMTRARTTVLPLAAALTLFSGAALAQDDGAEREAQLAFNNHCRTCHVTDEGDNRLGPSLHGVIGRKAGSTPGFDYSSAMANSGIVWDEATLDRFIANPDAVVSGNSMKPYTGITSAEQRAQIIAYLEAESEG